jgi:hypothetical protein
MTGTEVIAATVAVERAEDTEAVSAIIGLYPNIPSCTLFGLAVKTVEPDALVLSRLGFTAEVGIIMVSLVVDPLDRKTPFSVGLGLTPAGCTEAVGGKALALGGTTLAESSFAGVLGAGTGAWGARFAPLDVAALVTSVVSKGESLVVDPFGRKATSRLV